MTELVTINTESYATMAKAMGLPVSSGEKKTNILNRFRLISRYLEHRFKR